MYCLPGHAHALARRLNLLHDTDDFTVWRLSLTGPAVEEPVRDGSTMTRHEKRRHAG
jgi:hypothetical protein